MSAASPLRGLVIRGLELENNVWQAPLAGYSSAPFRLLSWLWGKPGLLATEMISANALAQQAPRQERYLAKAPGEGPVAFQLWGREPDAVGAATALVVERGADVIDLNCGCPVRKVRAAGAGSRLMEEPARIGALVAAMREHTDRPISIKIRVGPNAATCNAVEVARIAADAGVDLITVHGRHAGESYGTPCRYEEIARVVAAVPVPVIGNGDVKDGESARRMFARTGCAGVMVGRACMGAPWVFARIRAELTGTAFAAPSRATLAAVFLEHHDRLVEILGADLAIRHCRKLGCFYGRGLAGAKAFREGLNHCQSREDLVALMERRLAASE